MFLLPSPLCFFVPCRYPSHDGVEGGEQQWASTGLRDGPSGQGPAALKKHIEAMQNKLREVEGLFESNRARLELVDDLRAQVRGLLLKGFYLAVQLEPI